MVSRHEPGAGTLASSRIANLCRGRPGQRFGLIRRVVPCGTRVPGGARNVFCCASVEAIVGRFVISVKENQLMVLVRTEFISLLILPLA